MTLINMSLFFFGLAGHSFLFAICAFFGLAGVGDDEGRDAIISGKN